MTSFPTLPSEVFPTMPSNQDRMEVRLEDGHCLVRFGGMGSRWHYRRPEPGDVEPIYEAIPLFRTESHARWAFVVTRQPDGTVTGERGMWFANSDRVDTGGTVEDYVFSGGAPVEDVSLLGYNRFGAEGPPYGKLTWRVKWVPRLRPSDGVDVGKWWALLVDAEGVVYWKDEYERGFDFFWADQRDKLYGTSSLLPKGLQQVAAAGGTVRIVYVDPYHHECVIAEGRDYVEAFKNARENDWVDDMGVCRVERF
jgi:hypothetical protein